MGKLGKNFWEISLSTTAPPQTLFAAINGCGFYGASSRIQRAVSSTLSHNTLTICAYTYGHNIDNIL